MLAILLLGRVSNLSDYVPSTYNFIESSMAINISLYLNLSEYNS